MVAPRLTIDSEPPFDLGRGGSDLFKGKESKRNDGRRVTSGGVGGYLRSEWVTETHP